MNLKKCISFSSRKHQSLEELSFYGINNKYDATSNFNRIILICIGYTKNSQEHCSVYKDEDKDLNP